MADDHEERFRRHEEIMEGLARMLAAQHEFNRQQVEINADVKTTLARIESRKRNKFVCSYGFCDILPHPNSEGGSLYYGIRITHHRRESRCQ